MEGVAVKFDDDPAILPRHVDLETRHGRVDRRLRQPGLPAELDEATLKLRAGVEPGGLLVGEQRHDVPQAMAAGAATADAVEGADVQEPQALGLLERALELSSRQHVRQVEERSRHRSHGNPVAMCAVLGVEVASTVQGDPGLAVTGARRRDVDRPPGVPPEPQEVGGVSMAQERPWPTGEDRGHPAAAEPDASVPDRVDAAVDSMESTGRQAVFDRSAAKAKS